MEIILASKSPYRKQLLEQLGIEFKCVDSNFDEDGLKSSISDPIKLTQELARQKALAVAKHHPKALIIGSDQVCYFEGQILGKTGNLDLSLAQLKKMQGKSHQIITSYAIMNNYNATTHTNVTTLFMRQLSEKQIKKYLSADNPIDCAGSYKLEMKGISLFSKIKTEDHTAIIGLPLLSLADDLNKLGVQVPPV